MNLRSSTVDQRILANRLRKSQKSALPRKTFENRSTMVASGSESTHQRHIQNESLEDINLRKITGNEYPLPVRECEEIKRTNIDGSVSDNIGQLPRLDCLSIEKIKSTSAVNNKVKRRANCDLNDTSEQNFKPIVVGLKLSCQSFATKDRRRPLVQAPALTSKRTKNACNDSVESHSIGELACSCSDKSAQNKMDTSEVDEVVEETHDSIKGNNLSSYNYGPRNRISIQKHKLVSLGERNGVTCIKHMPWFGIDVGGSLVKVVFFDPKDATKEELVTLKRIRRYLKSSKAYGTTGKRDAHLEMPNCIINTRVGTLHFIRFATNQMPNFLTMAQNKGFADTINNVCATGGGAYKFEEDIKTNLNITLHKTDELDSIIHGIHYIDKYNSDRECYFLKDPLDDNKCVKVPYDFSRPYPYLVVNIGSGVSILAVYSSTSYSRISGSSIGGGTFLGLCCLLTQCKTFDEAIRLANNGSSTKIDKLVKDIYGGDYPKFNLSGDTVASSFGHMNVVDKRKDVKREDLARALLEMVTINIGSISRMCAANENIDRVVFIGNFLRVNQLSMKLLSYAVNYWSQGAMKALFLEHEGYFGAVGCFVESTQGCYNS